MSFIRPVPLPPSLQPWGCHAIFRESFQGKWWVFEKILACKSINASTGCLLCTSLRLTRNLYVPSANKSLFSMQLSNDKRVSFQPWNALEICVLIMENPEITDPLNSSNILHRMDNKWIEYSKFVTNFFHKSRHFYAQHLYILLKRFILKLVSKNMFWWHLNINCILISLEKSEQWKV